MHPITRAAGLTIALLCLAAPVQAQKATEQYIPIGMSPGVSNKYTSLGVIDTLSMPQRTVTVREAATRRTIRITDRTSIWLDRSKLKLPNLRGRIVDLQAGLRVEVKYVDPDSRQVAEWVKVEMIEP